MTPQERITQATRLLEVSAELNRALIACKWAECAQLAADVWYIADALSRGVVVDR